MDWTPPNPNAGGYDWGIIWQLHSASGSPPIAFSISDHFHFQNCASTSGDYDLSESGLNKGKWVDFVTRIKFAATATGTIEIWRRDEGESDFIKVLSLTNKATLDNDGSQHYWKHGLYRSPSSHTNIFYLDNLVLADTFEEAVQAAFGTSNRAPTDLTLSGHTVAENATTGTTVGTVTASDLDAGEDFIYALTDNAGGQFAIDTTSGVITVANEACWTTRKPPPKMLPLRSRISAATPTPKPSLLPSSTLTRRRSTSASAATPSRRTRPTARPSAPSRPRTPTRATPPPMRSSTMPAAGLRSIRTAGRLPSPTKLAGLRESRLPICYR